MEWISVKDRLPEQGGVYLAAYNDDEIYIAMYYDHIKEWTDYSSTGVSFPTHWMPLPEPPKDA